MNCQYCRIDVQKEWNFCPSCGHTIEKPNLFVDFLNRHIDQIKKKIGKYEDKQTEKIQGIAISITGFEKPSISFIQEPREVEQYKLNNRTPVSKKLLKNIIEPKYIINKNNGILKFQIELPDIENSEDIQLQIMSSSVELRANSKEVSYFKILKVPKKYYLTEKKLENGKLYLTFTL